MEKQRILWFQDGVKFRTPARLWESVDSANKRLASLVEDSNFDHEVVDSICCSHTLFNRVELGRFSAIVDLSGFFGDRVRSQFPNMSVIDNLHLSRVRVVSSPRLDGIGHIISLTPQQINDIRSNTDLSRPFFVDDVGWSGRTVVDAAKLLGIDFAKTTFGFLTLNQGDFGEGRPGASQLLQNLGATTIDGSHVKTPQDDGFHLSDFFDNPFLADPDVFDIVIKIQELREQAAVCDEISRKPIEQEIRNILSANHEVLFPGSLNTDQMRQIQSEGRLITSGGINKNALFGINPPNWLMPSFSRRVRSQVLRDHRTAITDTLNELRLLSRPNQEPRVEIGAEVTNSLRQHTGAERL